MGDHELLPEDLVALTELDQLVHQPARLSILVLLYVVESASFLYVARQTGLTRGNLSAHVSKLEAGGYAAVEKEFVDKIPHTLLSLTPAGREAFRGYWERMRQVMEALPADG